MASHPRRRDTFSRFLDTLKSVLAQIQSLFEEGPLSDNRVASLDALENLSIKMDEICETLVIFLNSFVTTDGPLWGQLFHLLRIFHEIKECLEEETNKLCEENEIRTSSVVGTTRNNGGRPKYEIDEEQVMFL